MSENKVYNNNNFYNKFHNKSCDCKYCKDYESGDETSEHSDYDDKFREPKVINCKPQVIVHRPKIIKCQPVVIKYKPEIVKCRPTTIKWYKPKISHSDSKTKRIGCNPIVNCDKKPRYNSDSRFNSDFNSNFNSDSDSESDN